jgi:hypothetical protein
MQILSHLGLGLSPYLYYAFTNVITNTLHLFAQLV